MKKPGVAYVWNSYMSLESYGIKNPSQAAVHRHVLSSQEGADNNKSSSISSSQNVEAHCSSNGSG